MNTPTNDFTFSCIFCRTGNTEKEQADFMQSKEFVLEFARKDLTSTQLLEMISQFPKNSTFEITSH